MNTDLYRIARQLEQARRPEEVFGDLGEAADLKKAYHRLAKLTHPDAYFSGEDQAAAQAAFSRLTDWYTRAQSRFQAGVYGSSNPMVDWQVVLRTEKREYVLENAYTEGPLYTRYPGSFIEDRRRIPVTVKIARDPRNNDLAENEARVLRDLANGRAVKKFGSYLPRLQDSFYYDDDGVLRQVNVFEREPGWVPLTEVRHAYPGGLDPQEVSWIWRRVLVALGFAHLNRRIHGAVLPGSIEILPELHGLRLVEWSFSVSLTDQAGTPTGECLYAIDPAYQDWYPEEVRRGETTLPGTDIDMAARCMIHLLGGDPVSRTLPAGVPQPLRAFFKGCTLPGKRARPQDAWALKEEYEELIDQLWGKLPFRPFKMHPTNQ